jgi:hypothetical protein
MFFSTFLFETVTCVLETALSGKNTFTVLTHSLHLLDDDSQPLFLNLPEPNRYSGSALRMDSVYRSLVCHFFCEEHIERWKRGRTKHSFRNLAIVNRHLGYLEVFMSKTLNFSNYRDRRSRLPNESRLPMQMCEHSQIICLRTRSRTVSRCYLRIWFAQFIHRKNVP